MEFAAPSTGGGSLRPADVEGHLLVVEPSEYVASIATSFGEKDAIRVTVHDISAQETHEDVLLFGTALIGSLKSQIGKRVLGVMGKGTAKPGQAPPWLLVDASTSADAVKAATAYLTGQVAESISSPAPAAAAPAADPQQSALDAALSNLSAAGLK
jgi:hypothetical protein